MTVYLRDVSHYDSNTSLLGYAGATHKVTEDTSYVDPEAGWRLNTWHAAGVQVLGSYHVLHTGNLQAQLSHWVSTLDGIAPWWRSHPHWLMQIDAERWPTDNVSPATVLQFAQMLASSGLPGFKVTYASRGQYGSTLASIATPLWNAAYHSSTYPGDAAADWAPYSGRTPTLWQYTSTPFDKNAFRGSLDELLALTGGNDMSAQTDTDMEWWAPRGQALKTGDPVIRGGPENGQAMWLVQTAKDLQAKVDALQVGGVDLDALAAKVAALVGPAVHAELAKLGITIEP